jgi:hypothetical protein
VSRKRVEIVNPVFHGQRFCRKERADGFVRRGMARYLADGRLEFTLQNQIQREVEAEYRRNRPRGFHWNGSSRDPRATYKPGQVRS